MGQLKNQKLNRKHFVSSPEFKQHLLQPLHNLEPEFQRSVLQRVLDEELTLVEMKTCAAEFRNISIIKSAFLRLTSSNSWSEAEEKFPAYTSVDRLSQFSGLNFKNNIPDTFRTYCQAALDSKTFSGLLPAESSRKEVNGVSVFFVGVNFQALSAEHLRHIDASFVGAQMVLYRLPEVSMCRRSVQKASVVSFSQSGSGSFH